VSWLRRVDPGLRVIRRATRVTVVACVGFYTARYALDSPVLATYSVFAVLSLGILSQVSGKPRRQALTMAQSLPAAWLLVTAGTMLAASDLAAALGMFVLGFLVSFAGVGGPRLVGLVNGLQLLYILPCFPPYAPGELGLRLAGVTVGIGLLAIGELVLWPDRPPRPYRAVLTDATRQLADCVDLSRRELAGEAAGPAELPDRLPAALRAVAALRPSVLDPSERPASAARVDRAFAQAGDCTRFIAGRVQELAAEPGTAQQLTAPAAATLLKASADSLNATDRWLRGAGDPPPLPPIELAISTFSDARVHTDPNGASPARLRAGALAFAVAEGARVLATAVRVAARRPIGPDPTPTSAQPGPFWYAFQPSWRLWWRRFRLNLTPRSVYFQGAVRLALALAAARLFAGALEVTHGFWVLLAVLTTMRASAAQTRAMLWPALAGTMIGAILAGSLLLFVEQPLAYEIGLPLLMVVGFAAGPLVGQLWGQALFTVVIAVIFTQIGGRDWRIAEVRVVDVVIGLVVGVLIGLVAWPRGGSGELHRAAGALLISVAGVIAETVGVLTGRNTAGQALPEARRRDEFAEACFALYQSEQREPHASAVDWQAVLVAARHAMRGAESLQATEPPATVTGPVASLEHLAEAVADAYRKAGLRLTARQAVADVRPMGTVDGWPTDRGPALYVLADARVWLDGLSADLTRIPVDQPRPSPVRAATSA